MDRKAIKKIFDFLETNESKASWEYKILYDLDNIKDNELIIDGNLNLSNKIITSLPDGLQVGGSLWLND